MEDTTGKKEIKIMNKTQINTYKRKLRNLKINVRSLTGKEKAIVERRIKTVEGILGIKND